MNRATISTLILSSCYLVLTTGALLYVYSSISSARANEATLRATLNEYEGKETLARSITETTAVTANDREVLAGYFLRETDTINFISRVETAAANNAVRFTMSELSTIPATDTTSSRLRTAFTVTGTQMAVRRYLELIEQLPYHSVLPTVLYTDAGDGFWQASVVLEVTLDPNL
jgi:hypothetical protein